MPAKKQPDSGFWKKELNSFGYAFRGIWQALRRERHMQIHAFCAFAVLACSWYIGLTVYEWCMVIFAIGLVMAAEIFNSAIEQLTNMASPNFDPLAGRVKDMSAGAVLVAAISAAIVGCLIFLPKIWALFTA
ncbi:diacylglycerol kinase [Sphingobacteriales bacterium UPWRP_1]|nr:hypothetical protein B6N25_15615 [Sphingobacteriales bacterium TSM_CSS]PSJ74560.1 diacylglycerol kinase [Sphingobacteriales bacterium UPWRP_1]